MSIALERAGESSSLLDSAGTEPFTQRSYMDLAGESFKRSVCHVVGRVEVKGKEGEETSRFTYYDARQLCKHLFELVISREGRKVRMKNTSNPVDDGEIKEISFFEIHPSLPSKGVFIGTQKEFLESNAFRARIFNRNDPFDALSINFVFKDAGPSLKRRNVVPVIISMLVLMVLILACTVSVVKTGKGTLSKPLASLSSEK